MPAQILAPVLARAGREVVKRLNTPRGRAAAVKVVALGVAGVTGTDGMDNVGNRPAPPIRS